MRKFIALIALCLFASIAAQAQDFKVIPVDPADAQEAARAHSQMLQAAKNYEDLLKRIEQKYCSNLVEERKKQKNDGAIRFTTGSTLTLEPLTWEPMFEFSDDFKYVLPKRSRGVTVWQD